MSSICLLPCDILVAVTTGEAAAVLHTMHAAANRSAVLRIMYFSFRFFHFLITSISTCSTQAMR
jgi:hypothetical protein